MNAFLLTLSGALVAAAAPPLPGGFTRADPKSSEVKAAAAFAVQAAAATGARTAQKPTLHLKSIVAARQQVVAGINYQLHLRITEDGRVREADATVWWQAWRRPDPYQLTAWKWRDAQAEEKAPPPEPPAAPR